MLNCYMILKINYIKNNCTIPIIADIHFNQSCNCSAEYVEKIRINPGNYIDKKDLKLLLLPKKQKKF